MCGIWQILWFQYMFASEEVWLQYSVGNREWSTQGAYAPHLESKADEVLPGMAELPVASVPSLHQPALYLASAAVSNVRNNPEGPLIMTQLCHHLSSVVINNTVRKLDIMRSASGRIIVWHSRTSGNIRGRCVGDSPSISM